MNHPGSRVSFRLGIRAITAICNAEKLSAKTIEPLDRRLDAIQPRNLCADRLMAFAVKNLGTVQQTDSINLIAVLDDYGMPVVQSCK
jgi:hypothetical protein